MQINRPLTGGLAAAGALAAGSLLPGCGTTRAAAPRSASTVARKRYGGNLRVGLTGGSPSDTLDPHQGLTYLDTARAQSLYEPLVQLSPAPPPSTTCWPPR